MIISTQKGLTRSIARRSTAEGSTTEGFIALFSVIIISSTLLLLTISLNLSSILGRFNILDSEIKQQSTEVADACVEVARLALATGNYTLNVPKSITVDQEEGINCQFEILTNAGVAEISSNVNSSHTYYEVVYDTGPDAHPITCFREVPDLTGDCE